MVYNKVGDRKQVVQQLRFLIRRKVDYLVDFEEGVLMRDANFTVLTEIQVVATWTPVPYSLYGRDQTTPALRIKMRETLIFLFDLYTIALGFLRLGLFDNQHGVFMREVGVTGETDIEVGAVCAHETQGLGDGFSTVETEEGFRGDYES